MYVINKQTNNDTEKTFVCLHIKDIIQENKKRHPDTVLHRHGSSHYVV